MTKKSITELINEAPLVKDYDPKELPPELRESKRKSKKETLIEKDVHIGKDKYEVLKEVWGYDSFRENQEEAIDLILEGKTDILYLARTSSGKSIVYQLPSLILDKMGIVISPLLSLMQDQVSALEAKGIRVGTINSDQGVVDKRNTFKLLKEKQIDILFIAPETLIGDKFYDWFVENIDPAFIAFDEAHCISQYGSDFRPKYKKCNILRDVFNCPFIALTATADKATVQDIKKTLRFQKESPFEFQEFTQDFDRPSITYNILKKDTKNPLFQLRNILSEQEENSTGVIYCMSRKQCEDVSYHLYTKGYKVAPYHAGMPKKKKAQILKDWMDGTINLVCCTTAFGLGIDKSNVRYVINYTIPSSIEDYLQMVGRASRDGLPSNAYLLYSPQDVNSVRFILRQSTTSVSALSHKNKKLDDMVLLVKSDHCIRHQLLNYFGQSYPKPNCGSCSNCVDRIEL